MRTKVKISQADLATFKHEFFNLSEVQLIYKPSFKVSGRPKMTCSIDLYNLLTTVWDEDRIQYVEQFYIILLNKASSVIGISPVSLGGITGTVADPKIIFTTALLAGASAIVLAHNHPSGNLKPSGADIELTNKVVAAGKLLDIHVLDHIIMTGHGFTSFADESWI